MRNKIYIRLFFLALAVSISIILFAYSARSSSSDDGNGDSGKCCEKKTQSEFILWESLTHNLLSSSQ